MRKSVATLAQIDDFDEIIDVRTPAEFAEDHIPGAINLPVLDDHQRVVVGTLYKQHSPFEARRLGAAMVAENIARHLYDYCRDKPKGWRPLAYCWRGGMRSGAFTTWLRMVGWDVRQLEGGYKQWRRRVVAEIATLPQNLDFRVLCGPTGSGKTRVLEALASSGAQVLDLEALAAHKGSVLGALPDRFQPTQKWFETCLYRALKTFDAARPVYVEAESRKIGRIQLPDGLLEHMRESPCIVIDASRSARLDFLLRDYAYLGNDPAQLQSRIGYLKGLHSNETLSQWKALAVENRLPELFAAFMDRHYDPLYKRSQNRNFLRIDTAPHIDTDDLSPEGIKELAIKILVLQTEPH